MRIINELYQDVEEILNRLVYYTISDLKELKEPERESLTEAYELLVGALACIHQSAFYRQPEIDEEEETRVCVSENPDPPWGAPLGPREDIDFSKVHTTYTSEQKGEEVSEGTPIDNTNHTYYLGHEGNFMWEFNKAARHLLSNTYELNYDKLTITFYNDDIIIIKKDYLS